MARQERDRIDYSRLVLSQDLPYRSRAVRALVHLHEVHLRLFVETWKIAHTRAIGLPVTEDPDYASLDTLCRHVLGAARGYVVWICEMLGLPEPPIRPAPDATLIKQEADSYLEHVLLGWQTALLDVADEQLDTPEYPSRWKTQYSIDAMLEHAVMHPIRHSFQLEELLRQRR